MSSSASFPLDELTCPICYDIFKDPHLLSCSHSFCILCLEECVNVRGHECPVCRDEFSEDNIVPRNLALKNVCETFLKNQRAGNGGLRCSIHNEELKLFCVDDQELACLVCQTSKKHKNHNYCPIDEAAQDCKVQTDLTVRQIREQFEGLYVKLREKELGRIAEVTLEARKKSKILKEKMRMLGVAIRTLSCKMQTIEEDLRAENLSFLQSYKASLKRIQFSLPEPEPYPGSLINVANHLGNLSLSIWDDSGITRINPFVFDPNTADARLQLSKDLTMVTNLVYKQNLPDNPERNTQYPVVLGSRGFRSGRHRWEVGVGNHPDWSIGVANASADRKGELRPTPQYGIWVLSCFQGALTNGMEEQIVTRPPGVLRVQLDYDKLSFYDMDYNSLIYTHKDTFTEDLYPYFYVGAGVSCAHSLKIYPVMKTCNPNVGDILW